MKFNRHSIQNKNAQVRWPWSTKGSFNRLWCPHQCVEKKDDDVGRLVWFRQTQWLPARVALVFINLLPSENERREGLLQRLKDEPSFDFLPATLFWWVCVCMCVWATGRTRRCSGPKRGGRLDWSSLQVSALNGQGRSRECERKKKSVSLSDLLLLLSVYLCDVSR